MNKIERALLSVSDKTGIVELASSLAAAGVTLLSTGGTARTLREAGLEVTDVSEVTGHPEIMDGRVKTLHPRIHGGLLGRRGTDDAVMAEHGIDGIDLLVVNLYPFEATIADPDCSREQAIENIDIGGPAMLRAAAKNHEHVCVVVDPSDYVNLLEEFQRNGGAIGRSMREELAAKAFALTARYDAAIAGYLGGREGGFPDNLTLSFRKVTDLRYGENPHQKAAFYDQGMSAPGTVAGAEQLQGKEISFNNLADADAALECVRQFDSTACVIVKHANPCGVALGDDPLRAYQRAYATDPVSAFGGIIAFNRELDGAAAAAIVEQQFVEVVVAPSFSDAALEAFAAKKNVRLLATGPLASAPPLGSDLRRIRGGLLVQDVDAGVVHLTDVDVVTRKNPEEDQLADLMFAWKVAKFVKSNAIVYARDGQTIGIGAGQMSRVDSARVAIHKAGEAGLSVQGSVMASDAFFPFRDTVDNAAAAGVSAIIQPGGSMRDEEVIAAADEHDLAMVFTGMRHFRH